MFLTRALKQVETVGNTIIAKFLQVLHAHHKPLRAVSNLSNILHYMSNNCAAGTRPLGIKYC